MKVMRLKLDRAIHCLIFLLVFFLPIDLKFTVGFVRGHHERVGQSAINIHNALTFVSQQALHLKITDIICLFLFVCISFAIAKDWRIIKKFHSAIYCFIVGFILLTAFSLFYHHAYYSAAQFKVCVLYLFKFAEVSLFYLFTLYFLKTKGAPVRLITAFILGGGMAAMIGLIQNYTGWFSDILVFDRVEFYGILAFFVPFAFCLFEIYGQKNSFQSWKKWLFYYLILIASIAILTCGKRTVMLGFLVGLIFILLRLVNRRNILAYGLLILSVLIVSFVSLSSQFTRTFDNEVATTISHQIVKQRVPLGQGLAPRFERRLQDSWLARFHINGLNYSVTSRLARWFYSTDKFKKHPIMGIGFYGVQYVYGFLPDNTYFQVLLESGLIGLFIFFIIICSGFYYSIKCICFSVRDKPFNKIYGIVWQGMTITFLVMGIGANVFYIFNLVGLYWIFTALLECLSKRELISETKEAK